jgi:hypothetical protein
MRVVHLVAPQVDCQVAGAIAFLYNFGPHEYGLTVSMTYNGSTVVTLSNAVYLMRGQLHM